MGLRNKRDMLQWRQPIGVKSVWAARGQQFSTRFRLNLFSPTALTPCVSLFHPRSFSVTLHRPVLLCLKFLLSVLISDTLDATQSNNRKLEKASTHKRATPAMFCASWSTFGPKINGFSALMAKHIYVKHGDPSCIGFWDIAWKIRQRQTYKSCCKPYPHNTRRRG